MIPDWLTVPDQQLAVLCWLGVVPFVVASVRHRRRGR